MLGRFKIASSAAAAPLGCGGGNRWLLIGCIVLFRVSNDCGCERVKRVR